MLVKKRVVRVTVPADISTGNRVTLDLEDALDIPEETLVGAVPVIVSKEDSSGNGAVMDEIAAISGADLVITEGSTGFTAGDVYTVMIIVGSENIATGVGSTV